MVCVCVWGETCQGRKGSVRSRGVEAGRAQAGGSPSAWGVQGSRWGGGGEEELGVHGGQLSLRST